MKQILLGLFIFLLLYLIWQYLELKKFSVTHYEMASEKVKKDYTVAVIADLHGFTYGKNNRRLLQAVSDAHPDMICIPGDMIVGQKEKSHRSSLRSLAQLRQIAPVYYSYGNHESRMHQSTPKNRALFRDYEKQVEEMGIHILNQKMVAWDDSLCISGLEIPISCYKKGKAVPLPEGFIRDNMPQVPKESFQILLAHNPYYAKDYAAWGADLTLCGHYHGGLVRIPGVGSLISPQFEWFPKYDAGQFTVDGRQIIVSRGMGTHTVHIRIFNRAELLVVHVRRAERMPGRPRPASFQ